jgi:TRAP-type C4-dicarboxylate transport system permease small subunit
MMLSFVGASLACAAGTHIAIDIVVRFIPQSWRKPAHVAGCAGAALVCLVSSWGFLDYVAVTGMHAKKEATAGEKIAYMQHELGDYFFLYRKQLSLDLGAIPYVVKGEKWNTESRMNGRQWNEFLDKGGFVERFGKEKIDALRVSEADLDLPRTPIIRANPKNGEEGFLINALDLIFPFGFLMLGLRLLLRCILVMAGHHTVEDGGGRDDEREAAGSGDGEPQKEAA